MSKNIKKGTEVVVTVGAEKIKGKRGTIARVLGDDRVIITGLNLVKRHTKKSQTSEGGIIEKEAPIHISNVVLATEFDARKKSAK
jgi:large subunit ribosomal protein L24